MLYSVAPPKGAFYMGKKKKPHLFFIYLTIFVNLIGFGMVFPLLPFYAREFHASEALIGLLASSFAIAQFIFSPFWGRLSDRFGRKPIISMALLGLSLAFLVFAISNSLTWLFISRFLQGVFSAAALPTATAYVADVTTKEDRIKGMSNLGASLALGFIFGPAIGGILSSVNHQLPFFAAAALAILNFVSVQLLLPQSLTKRSEKLVIKEGFLNFKQMYHGLRGELGSLFILIFLWSYGLSNNQVAVPLLGAEKLNIDASMVGLFFSAQGLVSALVQWLVVGKITNKIGEHHMAVLGLAIMAIALFLMPFSPLPAFMALAMMSLALGSALSRPTINTLISKQTHEGQGTTMGVATAFESMGRILGPLLGGILFYQFGYHSPFTVVAVLIFLMLMYVIKRKKFLKLEV